MSDTITTAFAPLVGLPCWGLERVQGSILSFEFGSPHLLVREPRLSTAASAWVRQRAAERIVKPVGEWNLCVFACHWRVEISGEELASDESPDEQIEAAMRRVSGQKLTAFNLDVASRTSTFAFDLGGTLKTSPYQADQDEQWSLYAPDAHVLTYRADGYYSFGPTDERPDEETWKPVPRSVGVP